MTVPFDGVKSSFYVKPKMFINRLMSVWLKDTRVGLNHLIQQQGKDFESIYPSSKLAS